MCSHGWSQLRLHISFVGFRVRGREDYSEAGVESSR